MNGQQLRKVKWGFCLNLSITAVKCILSKTDFSPLLSIASSELRLVVGTLQPMCCLPEMCIQLEIPGFYEFQTEDKCGNCLVPHFSNCLFDELDMTSLFVIQTGFIVIVMFPYDRLRSLCSPLLKPTQ